MRSSRSLRLDFLKQARASVGGCRRRRIIGLGRRTIYANQCEGGLHYPFLPADEFFDREHFPWFEQLEAATPDILEELSALLG